MIWLNHEHHPKYPKDISVDYCMGKHCHIRARCSKWEVQAGCDPPKLLGSCWNEFPWLCAQSIPVNMVKQALGLISLSLQWSSPKMRPQRRRTILAHLLSRQWWKGSLGLRGQRVKDGQRLGVYNIVQLRIPALKLVWAVDKGPLATNEAEWLLLLHIHIKNKMEACWTTSHFVPQTCKIPPC